MIGFFSEAGRMISVGEAKASRWKPLTRVRLILAETAVTISATHTLRSGVNGAEAFWWHSYCSVLIIT